MVLKQAKGKTIKHLEIVHDLDQRDVDIEFTDGTFLHIGMTPKIDVVTRFEEAEAPVQKRA